MIAVLSKPADQIGVTDLDELIDSEVPESDQIEFKKSLPTRDRPPDRWITHGDRIGDRARNELLEEAVAFANAYGGALLLGIRESDSRPPVAAEISPIPRCADLAERLKLVFRDCVEPQIPLIEIFAIRTAGACGVVVIRTGRSRMAPHRVKPTHKSTIRRSDRCEEMTMREIQDLTLNLSRGLERLERRLEARAQRFLKEFDRLTTPEQSYGIRVTAVPVGADIRFERVYGREELITSWRGISLVTPDGTENSFFQPLQSYNHGPWQPMLRAARSDLPGRLQSTEFNIYREIHCDGLVEIGVVDCRTHPTNGQEELEFRCPFFILVFANLLLWADRVRNEASSPSSEYALDVELSIPGSNARLFQSQHYVFDVDEIKSGPPIRYPRYSLGESGEITNLFSLLDRDFWDSIGSRFGGYEGEYVVRG